MVVRGMERLLDNGVVVGEKGECIAEGNLWDGFWGGVLGITEVQGKATEEIEEVPSQ